MQCAKKWSDIQNPFSSHHIILRRWNHISFLSSVVLLNVVGTYLPIYMGLIMCLLIIFSMMYSENSQTRSLLHYEQESKILKSFQYNSKTKILLLIIKSTWSGILQGADGRRGQNYRDSNAYLLSYFTFIKIVHKK